MLSRGGVAAFSVWGRPENTSLWTLGAQTLKEQGSDSLVLLLFRYPCFGWFFFFYLFGVVPRIHPY